MYYKELLCLLLLVEKFYDVLRDRQKFVFNLTRTFTTVRARRTTSRTLKIHHEVLGTRVDQHCVCRVSALATGAQQAVRDSYL